MMCQSHRRRRHVDAVVQVAQDEGKTAHRTFLHHRVHQLTGAERRENAAYYASRLRRSSLDSPLASAARWQQMKRRGRGDGREGQKTAGFRSRWKETPPLLPTRVTSRFLPRAMELLWMEEKGMSPHWISSIRTNTCD